MVDRTGAPPSPPAASPRIDRIEAGDVNATAAAAAAHNAPGLGLSRSPLSRLASPVFSGSDLSSSPASSAAFLSLSGIAASTPLSSLDGGDAHGSPVSADSSAGSDRGIVFPLAEKAGPDLVKMGVAPAAPAAPAAPTAPTAPTLAATTKMPQPIRAAADAALERGRRHPDTRSEKRTPDVVRDTVAKTTTTTTTTDATPAIESAPPQGRAPPATPLVQPKAIRPPSFGRAASSSASSSSSLPFRQPVPGLTLRTAGMAGLPDNIAQLEETAEQLSATGSIEDAIREAHRELKRSDSRRSSILAASLRPSSSSRAPSVSSAASGDVGGGGGGGGYVVAAAGSLHSDTRSSSQAPSRRDFSRQSSIIGLNSAARAGAFSPHDYILSPGSSFTGVSLQRSASKASSIGSGGGAVSNAASFGMADPSAPSATGDDAFPFLSRFGPGKGSVRSTRSGPLSLPEIAELELPFTLTQDALDEADRRIAAGEDVHDDDDTILAKAHQHIDADADADADGNAIRRTQTLLPTPWDEHPSLGSSPDTDSALLASAHSPPPMARRSAGGFSAYAASSSHYVPISAAADSPADTQDPAFADHAPSAEQAEQQQPDIETETERPGTAASGATFEQAQTAFRDFDGVHCDPELAADHRLSAVSELHHGAAAEAAPDAHREALPASNPHPPQPPRPTSYIDPHTGQQMLYYPARVPAMLQLPQKLSKNRKAAERNARRSQVLSMMMQGPAAREPPKPERQSRVWLPDPISENAGSPLMDTGGPLVSPTRSAVPLSPDGSDDRQQSMSTTRGPPAGEPAFLPGAADAAGAAGAAGDADAAGPSAGSAAPHELRRPSKLLDADKRKSRMSALGRLPPQLRASAYFDFPAATTEHIQVKNGSATDTLDSILDAAASAPVSAFTDHAFAGHLGPEVYGTEKKRRSKRNTAAAPYAADVPASKSRSSLMSMVGHIRKVSGGDDAPRLRRRLSKSMDGQMKPSGLGEGQTIALVAADEDEEGRGFHSDEEREDEDEEDEEGEGDEEGEEADAYQGAPTTLLAELQLRKQQQKMRTRPIHRAFPNGMHSTLLELDAVAEVERRSRKNKKVNLAWEEPALEDAGDGSDDEDIPLGVLLAAKAAGHNDVSAVVADLNRPLGLLDKKELEDNEPLSRRRDRLQGRDRGAASMYLGSALRRQSALTLTPMLSALNVAAAGGGGGATTAGGGQDGADSGVEEVEDEPLAARLRRIKAKEESELPRARPVSTAFSAELLGQFADPEEEAAAAAAKEKQAQKPAGEAEETLGQRRRRLQAEREARQQEMGSGPGSLGAGGLAVNGQALHALTGSDRLSRRLSMSDILAAHPLDTVRGARDPREAERLRRQEEARVARENEHKLAAMRAQMAPGAVKPAGFAGGPWAQPPGAVGGFMSNASALNLQRSSTIGGFAGMAAPYGGSMGGGMWQQPGFGAAAVGNNAMHAQGGYGGLPFAMPTQMPFAVPTQMPMQMPMPMAMPMAVPMQPPPQGQIDRVERWRQGVLP